MHWSASRSSECCCVGNTARPWLFGAARNCPESGGFADLSDTFSLKVSTLRGIPDVACGAAYNPIAFSGVHRKKPASAVRRAGEYMLQEVFSDGLYGNRFVPVEDESPTDRIRRMRPWGHWRQVDLRTGGFVFFRPKLRIVAFFPCFDSPKLDFFLMQNGAKRFKADRSDDLFFNKILSQFFKRPAFKGTIQKVRRAFSRFRNESLVVLSEVRRPAGAGLGLQRFKATFIEFFDNGSNMVFGVMNKLCNRRHFIALIGGKHHLGATHFDTTGTAAKDPLNLLAFADAEVSGVQTHKKSLSMRNNIEFFLRVCLYNTRLCIAQVLNIKMLNLFFRNGTSILQTLLWQGPVRLDKLIECPI